MPKVTVIVPNYNHARFLARRMDSIFSQTYQDFDVLYLDDASTDNSAEVIAPYLDNPRVRAIVNTQNTGSPFPQWNRGVRAAQGEYVWIAEADDDADPRLLERLVAQLDTHPNVGIAYCESWGVDEQGQRVTFCGDWTKHLDATHWAQDFVCSGRDECARFLAYHTIIPNVSGALLRKSVYAQAGFADETYRACGDWNLYVKMLMISDLAFVAEPLNMFRRHGSSTSSKSVRNGIAAEEFYRHFLYMRAHVPLTPEVAAKARAGALARWKDALLLGGSIPWSRNRAIYALARQADPHINSALVKTLISYLLRKLHLHALLRRGLRRPQQSLTH